MKLFKNSFVKIFIKTIIVMLVFTAIVIVLLMCVPKILENNQIRKEMKSFVIPDKYAGVADGYGYEVYTNSKKEELLGTAYGYMGSAFNKALNYAIIISVYSIIIFIGVLSEIINLIKYIIKRNKSKS